MDIPLIVIVETYDEDLLHLWIPGLSRLVCLDILLRFIPRVPLPLSTSEKFSHSTCCFDDNLSRKEDWCEEDD